MVPQHDSTLAQFPKEFGLKTLLGLPSKSFRLFNPESAAKEVSAKTLTVWMLARIAVAVAAGSGLNKCSRLCSFTMQHAVAPLRVFDPG